MAGFDLNLPIINWVEVEDFDGDISDLNYDFVWDYDNEGMVKMAMAAAVATTVAVTAAMTMAATAAAVAMMTAAAAAIKPPMEQSMQVILVHFLFVAVSFCCTS
uniref:Uncharacterized protein n=1 Tax=Oryza barthii TaxID=65489 RepID=A0A0D3GN63_9ORYZ